MALNSFTSNQGTQTPILTDNTGGVSGTVIAVQKVDISGQGTAGTLWNGGVTGTINSGSMNLIAGTIATLGTMGTLGLVNTVTTVTTVSNLTNGSVNVTTGTIATLGTMGTLGTALGIGTLANQGSLTNIGQLYNAGTVQNQLAGTITALQNGTIVGGTLQNLNFGSIAISDGTTKVNVMASGVSNGTGAQNALLTAGGFAEFSGSATAAGADLIAAFDVSQYKWVSIQIGGTYTGTINWQASNDNSNFFNIPVTTVGNTSAALSNTMTGNSISETSIYYRYARLHLTSLTGAGTANATIEVYANASQYHTLGVQAAQNGAWNIGGTLNAGTIGTITNIGQVYNAGTLQAGTIQQDPLPVRAVSTYGTHGTTGVSIFGTLAGGTGSGAGSEIFCTSVSLSIPSTGGSQDVSIGWGSNTGTFQAGTGLIVRGNFPPGGGIQKEFNPPINSGTNAQLMVFQAGAGTVDVSVTYFTAVSSI